MQVCKDYNITSGSCLIACDVIAALKKATSTPIQYISPKHTNADLLNATSRIIQYLPIHITTQHVLGHQDSHTPFELLPRIAQLNVIADSKAKFILNKND